MHTSVRNILHIDASRCNGCGLCAEVCIDHAIAMRGNQALLVADHLCDGLGGCLTSCPEKALSIVRRAAPPYTGAASDLKKKLREEDAAAAPASPTLHPGSPQQLQLADMVRMAAQGCGPCRHWPLKMKLVPPDSAFLRNADLLVAADCTAFAYAGFHTELSPGRVTVIACPRLEDPRELQNALAELLRQGGLKSCSIARMVVPCCKGLRTICREAAKIANSDIPFSETVIGLDGLPVDEQQ